MCSVERLFALAAQFNAWLWIGRGACRRHFFSQLSTVLFTHLSRLIETSFDRLIIMEETKIRSKLKILNESLDELEEKLEPLLAQTLPETLAELETLQQAKLQIDIPYVVYDLIFSVCSSFSLTCSKVES